MPSVPPSYLSGLLGDPEVEALLSGEAMLRAMLETEAVLAEAQAETGDIPAEAAEAIAAAARRLTLDPEELAAATQRDGVPVPALIGRLRDAVPQPHGHYAHWGATSQDILDTATVLTLGNALETCAGRLEGIIAALAGLADCHRSTVMAARTRGQQATLTSFGLKTAGWLLPLIRWRDRLPAVQQDLLVVSLGGASGTQAALGKKARAVETGMAQRLGLSLSTLPWHVQRDGPVQAGAWLAGLAGSLAKIAGDVAELCSSEIGELQLAGAGGSSTMPNKQNPTRAEAIQALAGQAFDLHAAVQRSALHRQERGGVAWFTEWLSLPPLAVATAAALRHSLSLLDALEVDAARMRANVEASNGLLLAEAASFALAEQLPRGEAQELVKQACSESLESGTHLLDSLAAKSSAAIDWQALRDPARQLGNAEEMIDRALAAAKNTEEET
ncbi:MAG: adenylosuccinate lyase family protein [Rhodovibrionaceae bacterium]